MISLKEFHILITMVSRSMNEGDSTTKNLNEHSYFPMPLSILPFVSGLLLLLASPVPGFAALSWIGLIPLFIFLCHTQIKRAFYTGWLAGTAYYLTIIYWVTISMETYGGLSPWLSISALALLCIYMGLYQGLFCLFMAAVLKKRTTFPIWIAPCLWVGLDYLRGTLFTGLPWMDIGYFQYESAISQLADLGGHSLVTFLVVLVNGILLTFWRNKSFKLTAKKIWPALLCVLLAIGYCPLRLSQIEEQVQEAPQLATAVVQGNINQAVKWDPKHKLSSVNKYIRLTDQTLNAPLPPKLILWPETALPFYPTIDPVFYHVKAETVLKDNADYELLSGAPHIVRRKAKGYDLYNSALILRSDQSSDYYYKQHLVPFGEYIPFRTILPFPKAIVQSIGDFTPGTHPAVLKSAKADIGVLICIEAIFPDLARKQVDQGADILANITNDAWFGRSSAPIQHLAMTVFRAIENRRSLARAANTGISALVSPTGEILAATDLFVEATLNKPLPLLTTRTIFSRLGFLFPLVCLAAATILLIHSLRAKAIDD